MIYYTIAPSNPFAHIFTVTITIATPDANGQLLRLPAWIPGSYMIRDFAKNIVQLAAFCDGAQIDVQREDKSTWHCAPCEGELRIEYDVYAWDLSVRTAHLDQTHGFFNGTSVFLEVVHQADQPCRVDIQPPQGDQYRDWKVATSMPLEQVERYQFGCYKASNYDELIDHPVEMGNFSLASFEACGVQHDIVITGKHTADMDRLCSDLKVICEHHINFFGQPAPVDYYVFLTMVVGHGYGGLEHRASTALLCSREDLPHKSEAAVSKRYRDFLGLCSHEYFHTWNVKRIKPAAFEPFDLSKEQHTRLLWAFEGITSYYDDLSLVRCHLITAQEYLNLLATTATRVYRAEGRHKQTVTDSSFDAWTKFYKQDENAPNAIVSYYTKGALIALCLDVFIRQQTNNTQSLDNLMHSLWTQYGDKGVPEEGIEKLVEDMVGPNARAFFDHVLRSTKELPVQEALSYLGVEFSLRAASSQADNGGIQDNLSQKERAVLGVRSSKEHAGAKLLQVFDHGAAQLAGLSVGDIIVAVDSLKINDLDDLGSRYSPKDKVMIHAFRRDELMTFELTLQAAPADTAQLKLKANLDEQALAIRQNWLAQ